MDMHQTSNLAAHAEQSTLCTFGTVYIVACVLVLHQPVTQIPKMLCLNTVTKEMPSDMPFFAAKALEKNIL